MKQYAYMMIWRSDNTIESELYWYREKKDYFDTKESIYWRKIIRKAIFIFSANCAKITQACITFWEKEHLTEILKLLCKEGQS